MTRTVGLAALRDSAVLHALRTRSGRSFVRYWVRAGVPQDARVAQASSVARSTLHLGPNGTGC